MLTFGSDVLGYVKIYIHMILYVIILDLKKLNLRDRDVNTANR